ncbi:MAG: zinc ribbon domain-containing protein [Clostridia bacterium]|nr:zinc ribbon domain-containing protein [Clostridia bacterium]
MDIKSIIDDVTEKAGSLAKSAVKKTGEAAETAKFKFLIKSEQKKLDAMFTELGKLFYKQVKGTDVRAQAKAQIMEIDEQKRIISDLKSAIIETAGKMICDSCGKAIDLEHTFCPECGKKIEPKLFFDHEQECETDAVSDDGDETSESDDNQ